MAPTWKDIGLIYQKQQRQIPDAQWQLAIQHGFDHCQRQMMWRPVAHFSGSRRSCDDCATSGNAGNAGIRTHNRYHYYDDHGQRLPSAGPDPGLPAAPLVAPAAVPAIAALPMVPPVMPSPAAAPFGVLGAVTNPNAVPAAVTAPVFGSAVSAPEPKAADTPAISAGVTAREPHAHSEWNPKVAFHTEKEVLVNTPHLNPSILPHLNTTTSRPNDTLIQSS
jgi:hypothetical protein